MSAASPQASTHRSAKQDIHPMSRPPRILFVSYGGGHVSMVLPVIRELEALLPGADCQLMALTTGHLKARAVRPTLGYRDFLHLVDAAAARRWGERLIEDNASPDVPADETIAYLGINYLDLIAQYGKASAADLYREQGRYGFKPLHFMRRVIDALQPDVVVATNSPRSEQAALDVARELGVPSVGMVDLFGQDDDTYLHRPVKPLRTCVLSLRVRERLIAAGFVPEGIVVTGNPAFDGLLSPVNHEAAQQFLHERGWIGLRPILWAGHDEPRGHPATPVPPGPGLALEVEGLLRDLVRQDPRLALIVRYHPNQWHRFSPEPSQERVHFSVPSQEAIHPLILASALVVVQNSTVGLEAAVAGKPVLSVENAPSVHIGFSLARMGVSTPCPTPQDLAQLAPELLSGPASVPTEYASDGRAAQRVAFVVQSVLETRPADIQSESDNAFQ